MNSSSLLLPVAPSPYHFYDSCASFANKCIFKISHFSSLKISNPYFRGLNDRTCFRFVSRYWQNRCCSNRHFKPVTKIHESKISLVRAPWWGLRKMLTDEVECCTMVYKLKCPSRESICLNLYSFINISFNIYASHTVSSPVLRDYLSRTDSSEFRCQKESTVEFVFWKLPLSKLVQKECKHARICKKNETISILQY